MLLIRRILNRKNDGVYKVYSGDLKKLEAKLERRLAKSESKRIDLFQQSIKKFNKEYEIIQEEYDFFENSVFELEELYKQLKKRVQVTFYHNYSLKNRDSARENINMALLENILVEYYVKKKIYLKSNN